MQKLTANEEEVMLIIWKVGEGNVKSFMEEMEAPLPPYTTVASIVKNLEKKGYVKSRKLGNTLIYRPVITNAQYKKYFLHSVVKNHFDNSYKEMVSFFLEQRNLSEEELKELLSMVKKNDKK